MPSIILLLCSLYFIALDGLYPFNAHCCHMGTAIKHPVPDWVKQSFVIFDIRALRRSALSVRVPGCQKLQMMVWHMMLYSCSHMATVGVKGLIGRWWSWHLFTVCSGVLGRRAVANVIGHINDVEFGIARINASVSRLAAGTQVSAVVHQIPEDIGQSIPHSSTPHSRFSRLLESWSQDGSRLGFQSLGPVLSVVFLVIKLVIIYEDEHL